MLDLARIAHLASADYGVNLGVLSGKQLSLILRHVGESEHEVHLFLEIRKKALCRDERVVNVEAGDVIFLGCGRDRLAEGETDDSDLVFLTRDSPFEAGFDD